MSFYVNDPYAYEIIAIPITETTTRYLCGVCKAIVPSKSGDWSACRKCGAANRIVRVKE